MLRYLLGFVLCFLSLPAFSQSFQKNTFSDYYSVSEIPQVAKNQTNVEMDPLTTLQEFFGDGSFADLKIQFYELLNFEHHTVTFGDTGDAYNRLRHFGTWIHDPRDHDCYNTRAKVLIRESQTPVNFASSCTVKSGQWLDPYTGGQYDRASDIQIDHFVPLKNAFVSGAWRWDYRKRCLYANFLGNDFHLLAVLGRENMSKSDKGPEAYMPPSRSYQCQYVEQWLKVKLIWEMGLNPDETRAIQKIVNDNHCDPRKFKFPVADLRSQRNFITTNLNLCAN